MYHHTFEYRIDKENLYINRRVGIVRAKGLDEAPAGYYCKGIPKKKKKKYSLSYNQQAVESAAKTDMNEYLSELI